MKIEANGIIIERLLEKDIELVRQWRNSSFVSQHMNYQDYITPEMQQKWFRSVNNFNNFYFIVKYKRQKVGLGNIKNVDWEKRTGEAGLFVAEKTFLSSFLPVIGGLSLSDLVFKIFHLQKLFSHVKSDNKRAVRFNKLFGYKEADHKTDEQLYELTQDDFQRKTKKLFLLIKPLGFKTGNLTITLEAHDYQTDFGEQMEKLILESGMNFKRVTQDGLSIFREES